MKSERGKKRKKIMEVIERMEVLTQHEFIKQNDFAYLFN